MCIFFFVIIDKTRPWTLLTHAQNLLLQEALLWNQIFVWERDLSCICMPISNWITSFFLEHTDGLYWYCCPLCQRQFDKTNQLLAHQQIFHAPSTAGRKRRKSIKQPPDGMSNGEGKLSHQNGVYTKNKPLLCNNRK